MFFKALSYFKALSAFKALLFLHKRFCFIFYMSQHLYIFSDYKSARYFTFLPNYHAAIISIS